MHDCGAHRPAKRTYTAQSVRKHDLTSPKHYATAIFGYEHRKWWYFKRSDFAGSADLSSLASCKMRTVCLESPHPTGMCRYAHAHIRIPFWCSHHLPKSTINKDFLQQVPKPPLSLPCAGRKKLNQALQSTSKLALSYHITPGSTV